ncbi:MAG: heat-shock protein Hsp70, partial [Taibaiella sp.]|nr:heat-shock protein Hsp70 [Taibaiella sp.]
VEATTEAQQMLDTTEKFTAKYRDQLTEEEVNTTHEQMQLLRQAITAADKDRIQHQTEQLNEVSRPYAERVMEGALKDAMKGKKVI